jgi:hypothetical protein
MSTANGFKLRLHQREYTNIAMKISLPSLPTPNSQLPLFKTLRPAKRLLLSGVLVSVGLWTLPVQAQSAKQVTALVEALRQAAPQTGRADDGLYSDWQIKPENIPRWSRLCTGETLTPSQFEANPTKARQILACVMQDVLRDEYKASSNNESLAVQRAASWWMTGDPNQYSTGSIATYTKKVLGFYQQQLNNSQTQQPATPSQQPAVKPSAQPPSNPSQPPSVPATPPPANQGKPTSPSSAQPPAPESKPTSSSSVQPPAPESKPTSPSSAQPPAPESKPTSPSSAQPPTRSSASAPISDTQVGTLVEALRQAAPPTDSANKELYSEWQVKAENIPRWSQQCIGKELTPAQFRDSPVTARAILVCVMRDVFRDQYSASSSNEFLAVQRAASWWMTGDATQYASSAIAPYTEKVLDFYTRSRLKFFSHI